MSMQETLIQLLSNVPYELINVENESPGHAGHAGGSSESHFVLRFKKTFHTATERMEAHKTIYQAIISIYPSQIHSIVLKFE